MCPDLCAPYNTQHRHGAWSGCETRMGPVFRVWINGEGLVSVKLLNIYGLYWSIVLLCVVQLYLFLARAKCVKCVAASLEKLLVPGCVPNLQFLCKYQIDPRSRLQSRAESCVSAGGRRRLTIKVPGRRKCKWVCLTGGRGGQRTNGTSRNFSVHRRPLVAKIITDRWLLGSHQFDLCRQASQFHMFLLSFSVFVDS